jgi:hypothetical protein
MIENGTTGDHVNATVAKGAPLSESGMVVGKYHVECRNAAGDLMWVEDFKNVVTLAGLDLLLGAISNTSTLGAPFLGFYKGSAPTDASTMTTPIFTEIAVGVIAARVAPAGWAATSGTTPTRSKATSSTNVSCVGTDTILGCFLVTGSGAVSTVGSTAGVLYSAGAFASSKSVNNGDTLAVTYTASLTRA